MRGNGQWNCLNPRMCGNVSESRLLRLVLNVRAQKRESQLFDLHYSFSQHEYECYNILINTNSKMYVNTTVHEKSTI